MNLRGFIKYALYRDTTHQGEFQAMQKLAGKDSPRIFVDVGANDGFYGSNSYPYVARGWQAVLIEPHPGAFKKLQQRHAGRKNVTLLNLACADKAGKLPLWFGPDGEAGTQATISDMDYPEYGLKRSDTKVEVGVERLDTVLAAQSVPHNFGILSIDVERMDYEVLLGIDLKTWRPRVIITEDFPPKNAARDEYMKRCGYRHAAQCDVNSLWVPAGANS